MPFPDLMPDLTHVLRFCGFFVLLNFDPLMSPIIVQLRNCTRISLGREILPILDQKWMEIHLEYGAALFPLLMVCITILTYSMAKKFSRFWKRLHQPPAETPPEVPVQMPDDANNGIQNLETPSQDEGIQTSIPFTVAEETIFLVDSCKRFSLSGFQTLLDLGSGSFGKVALTAFDPLDGEGIMYGALKSCKEGGTPAELSTFMTEISVLTRITPHLHVVRLLGYSVDLHPKLLLEYCSKGALDLLLQEYRREVLGGSTSPDSVSRVNRNLRNFAQQVASGMSHIVQCGFIHRDLATRNILISRDGIAKIGDFGFAVKGIEIRERVENLDWVRRAPECHIDGVYSEKSDVYSFGMMLYEMAGIGTEPFAGRKDYNVLLREMETGCRPIQPPTCSMNLFRVIQKCWDMDIRERPTFATLKDKFGGDFLDVAAITRFRERFVPADGFHYLFQQFL